MQDNNFNKYEKNIRSQFGEDGVIAEIFKRIGSGNKFCIEFGAWDGEHLCNTYNLFVNEGWHALLIEGDKEKTDTMKSKFSGMKTTILNTFVRAKGESSIENILKQQKIESEVDLLSIDIDGDDYYILAGLEKLKPRLLIIEYNPTIPPGIDLVQKPGESFGCSATALLRLAKEKGYSLAHVTETNLFLVRNDEFPKLNIPEQDLISHRIEKNYSYLISAYDGRSYIYGDPAYGTKASIRLNRLQKLILRLFFSHKNPAMPAESSGKLKPVIVEDVLS